MTNDLEIARDAWKRGRDLIGGPAKVSALLGGRPTPQAISQWEKVPPAHVLSIETATGISRHELRPDVFGAAPADAEPQSEGEAA